MPFFRFYWLDGYQSFGEGRDVAEAFSLLGYGGGAIGALDYYETVRQPLCPTHGVPLLTDGPGRLHCGTPRCEESITVDRYGRVWPFPTNELCHKCGQPDSCGDCNHKPLSNSDHRELMGDTSYNTYFPETD